MGAGATKAGVPIQYCMAYGRHTVASASIPAVNQVSQCNGPTISFRCICAQAAAVTTPGLMMVGCADSFADGVSMYGHGKIRASDDYATGVKATDPKNANLFVGTSSMLAAALGLAPSKDVFWSSSSERSASRPPTYSHARSTPMRAHAHERARFRPSLHTYCPGFK